MNEEPGPAPRIDFLFWSECPSHERALAELRAAIDELGLDPAALVVREIRSRERPRKRTSPARRRSASTGPTCSRATSRRA